ncbi:hypothetical protein B0H67DRAFT_482246 [Lasiosphaeris hirsuta]|uniref:Glycosyl transferase family 8 protein n=1 Tax=Lasiosphaeris hirsuta TaxID=260670 RepID=A0AA40AZQ8_9PEZI|nr:hypothetical protein B0H67DRAFT_482246 [Lasiosphaeris hirsuta]
MLVTMPNHRQILGLMAMISTAFLLIAVFQNRGSYGATLLKLQADPKPTEVPRPKYKPTPTYVPPPINDNFPLLATSTPPPIPKWNVPRKYKYKDYDLTVAPPLLIGFTRTWPILLQAVTSYLTAGWPADQIYVIENTGVQQANTRGQLSMQNPFYLNHTVLQALGVNIIQTPTLLSFSQLQNFYLSLSYSHNWPYYFWSHMDVLALSFEDGHEGLTPRYTEEGYKSLYTLALEALRDARKNDARWGVRFFAYDHLALVNPVAYEDVGGWDTLIPYYITDCDMHSRLTMRNWSMVDVKAGIITDVSVSLNDLSALYRVDGVETDYRDPNPPPPPPPPTDRIKKPLRRSVNGVVDNMLRHQRRSAKPPSAMLDKRARDENIERWRKLLSTADSMFHYKHGDRGRNTWQTGQHGGQGEPFYYDAAGLAEGIDVMTETGREVYRRKWGHRDCGLIQSAGLGFDDQWRVEKDWSD